MITQQLIRQRIKEVGFQDPMLATPVLRSELPTTATTGTAISKTNFSRPFDELKKFTL